MRRREEEVEVEEQIVPARHNEGRANAGSSTLTGAGAEGGVHSRDRKLRSI